MHIFFSGIGGSGIGPLALIAKQAGYSVSGSDQQESFYTRLLTQQGVRLYIGQTPEAIAAIHAKTPIDWLVCTSAITRENTDHPELVFARQHGIKISLRDELLNKIIQDKNLKLLGIAGTHGKSTTTAMVVWLFQQLGVPIGHSVGAKIPFAPMGQLRAGSEFFVYECDEFDRNFLSFHPYIAAITGIGWDHHEIFPTEAAFKNAFSDFIAQSRQCIMWQSDAQILGGDTAAALTILDDKDPSIHASITLRGEFNRRDAWLAVQTVHMATGQPTDTLVRHINAFPGLKQRMEQLLPNLYTNYAHTPEKIKGGMSVAFEIAKENGQDVVVIYEPLTNRRQHYIKGDYKNTFEGAKKVYWVRTYLAREDPGLPLLSPEELIKYLDDPGIATPAKINETLLHTIKKHLAAGDLVVVMGASGAGSLDEWLRQHIKEGAL